MWAPVLALNVAAVVLGLGLPRVDDALGVDLPIALTAVEQILGALAAGMITFTGIVFSAVFVAAQIQTSSYSPRLAARLRRDRVIIAGLAVPTATASYSLFALASVGREAERTGDEVVPGITVLVALIFTCATFAVFVALVQRAFDSTQIGGILRGLLRRAHHVVEDVHPRGGRVHDVEPPTDATPVELRHAGPPGVIAAVDRSALVRLAKQTGAFVDVLPMIGEYIPPGTPILRLHGGERPASPDAGRRVLVFARQRTMDQDPAFALRMFVDIAIRALSAAINDPTTAVQALDRIETMLVDLHARDPGPAIVTDERGVVRGRFPAPSWDKYVDLALTEVRHYGGTAPQVARRLRALHGRLLEIVDDSQRARIELERRLLDEQLIAAFPDPREREILEHPDRLGLGGAP
jgi:uncharacterized membrane protein